MSSIAVTLVLVAAVLHAGWNRLLHDVEDRVAALAIAGLTSFVLLLPAIVTAPPVHVPGLAALSGLVEAAYALCLAAAYRRGALSLAYPIGRGTAPLLVTLGGWVVLSQQPGPTAIGGAVSLGLGLVAVATAGRHQERWGAVGFALLTGCCIAGYSLIDARAVRDASPAGYLGVVLGIQGLFLTASLRGDWTRLRRALRTGLLISVGTVGAYLLVLFAFQRANAGRVATLREVSILIGLLIARDRPGPQAWLGGALVVAGAFLAVE